MSSPHICSLLRSSLMHTREGLDGDGEVISEPSRLSLDSAPDLAPDGGASAAGGGEDLAEPPLTTIWSFI